MSATTEIAAARRMLASLHGRSLDDMTEDEQLALCRGGAGCVLCCGMGCGGSNGKHGRCVLIDESEAASP